ncbi:MAG: hypothetical protein EON94_14565, partial [Caulobacteraceae bacterium]
MLSRHISLNKKIIITFVPILVALGAMAAVVWINIANVQTANGWDMHTTTVLSVAEEARAAFKEQRASTRGFIITADKKYDESFDTSYALFNAKLDALATLTADNPAQQARIVELRRVGQEYKVLG